MIHCSRICTANPRFVHISNAVYARTIQIALKTRINAHQRKAKYVNIHIRWEALQR